MALIALIITEMVLMMFSANKKLSHGSRWAVWENIGKWTMMVSGHGGDDGEEEIDDVDEEELEEDNDDEEEDVEMMNGKS